MVNLYGTHPFYLEMRYYNHTKHQKQSGKAKREGGKREEGRREEEREGERHDHLIVFLIRENGLAHGVFMLNSNAQDWVLNSDHLTYKVFYQIFIHIFSCYLFLFIFVYFLFYFF